MKLLFWLVLLGYSWDDPQPKFINQLKNVVDIAAGSRHSLALVYSQTTEVYGWGYNAYGELGLGDVDVRLHPTKITAIKNTRVCLTTMLLDETY